MAVERVGTDAPGEVGGSRRFGAILRVEGGPEPVRPCEGGIAAFPDALLGLFDGVNTGKLLLKV